MFFKVSEDFPPFLRLFDLANGLPPLLLGTWASLWTALGMYTYDTDNRGEKHVRHSCIGELESRMEGFVSRGS
jgi:hypothetical protein